MPSEEGLKEFLAPDSEVKYFACFDGEDMIGFYCDWFEDWQMATGLGLKSELTGQAWANNLPEQALILVFKG